MLKIQFVITGINYILKYIKIQSVILIRNNTVFLFLLVFKMQSWWAFFQKQI